MSANRVIFIDSRVSGYQEFINGLFASSEVVLLTSESDGVEQIATYLRGRTGIDSIHLVSHGSQGALYLGNTVLNNGNLALYESQLSQIGSALTESGDLLLYGCNVAQENEGVKFITSLAQITAADIAASNDITIANENNGNLVLELSSGNIDARELNLSNISGQLSGNTAPSLKLSTDRASKIEVEYNDERSYATPFTNSLSGSLSNYNDVDWYSVKFNEIGLQSVTFDASTMTFGSWNVYWYDPSMVVMSGRNIGPSSNGIEPFTYIFPAFSNGTYYLRVQATAPFLYNGGSYNIYFSQTDQLTYIDSAADDSFTVKSGTLIAIDPDIGTTFSYGITGTTSTGNTVSKVGSYGTLTVNKVSGEFIFTPNDAAIEAQKANTTETYVVYVSDGMASTTSSYKLNFIGADDPTSFSGDITGTVSEDGVLKANGILNVIDRDSGDSEVVSQVKTTGVYGVFNIAANGAWAYELNNIASNVQSLLGGQNVSDIFNITTTGGVKQNIVITVSGETSPSIAISSDKKSLKAGDSAIFTFTLTEPSTNFIVSDVTVTGGTLSNFMGSGTSYTALFTPPPNSVIDGIVSIASGVFTDATGKPNADGSDANNTVTISVANLNDAPTGSVSISGTATQRQTLTAANTLADGNGLGTIAYQWMADGVSINGATSSTLTLAQAQVGKVISVSASYIDLGGTSESVTSNATSAVANVNDLPTGAVTIRGTVKSGQTLRAASNIADVDGLGTLNHQWKANGSVITGATYDTLTLTNDLVGKAVSVVVSYTDLSGSNETVASVATSSVLAADDAGVTTPAIRGHVYQWKTHTLLSSVDVVVGQQVSVTNMEGKYQIKPSSMGALSLSVSREMTLIETGNAISSADALAALKIAVGRSPNADGSVATPYQLIAADVNQDGKVTSADALAILKMAVKRSDALPREWLFVSESQDFWGESANNGQGGYTISRTNVAWNKDLQATVTQDTTLNLLAVLKGDVNGSWTGPSTGTQNLQTPYFSDLTSKGLGPLSTWGVVAA